MRRILMLTTCLVGLCVGPARAQTTPPAPVPGLDKVQHIIVLYLENRSFDNLYGLFPGAEGLASVKGAPPQVDLDGNVLATLPPVVNTSAKPPVVDARFPANLPNAPFRVEQYVTLDKPTGDLVHRWYQEQEQIDGGKMDKFAAVSDAKGLVMGYYDGSALPMWTVAKDYVLGRQFLPCCIRRLVPEPCLAYLRVFSALRRSSGSLGCHRRRPGAYGEGWRRHPGRLCGEHDPVRPHAAQPGHHRQGQAAPAANAAHHRRSAVRQGRELGLVFRRLERCGRRASRRTVPVSPPAIRLLPAIRRRHGRAGRSTSRTRPSSSRRSTMAACRSLVQQALRCR